MGGYPSIVGIVDEPFSYDTNFIGASNFSGNDLPDGVTVNSAGTISGTVSSTMSAELSISYINSEELGTTTIAFMNILDVSYSDFFYYASAEFTLNPQIVGDSSFLSTFSIFPALPDGASIDPDTGVISGTIYDTQDPVTYTVTFVYGYPDLSYSVTFDLGGVFVRYYPIHATVGDYVNYDPDITGTLGLSVGAFTLAEDDTLPGGLNLDFYTGRIYGTVTEGDGLIVRYVYFLVSGITYSAFVCFRLLPLSECLRGDMRVLTNMGYKEVNVLTINDHVITNHKKTRKIKNIHTTDHHGSLYCIPKQSLSVIYPLNDVYLSGNHKFYHKGRWYRPRTHCKKIQIEDANKPIKLYHVELDNPDENIIVEGVVMESYNGKEDN